jgi:hypothetical protein
MNRYLYGFNVFGIQSFIGSSSKLKEIVGASELVEAVCKNLVSDQIQEMGYAKDSIKVLQAAAGHFRCLIVDENLAKEIVKRMPLEAEKMAPGIGLAQSLVTIEKDLNRNVLEKLEQRLRIQRNKIASPSFSNLMIMRNSRKSGLASVYDGKGSGDYLDLAALRKVSVGNKEMLSEKALPAAWRKQKMEMTKEFTDIAKEGEWLGVVHIDGNDLGLNLVKLWKKWEQSKDISKELKEFSEDLERSTISAFQKAVQKVYQIDALNENGEAEEVSKKLPYRVLVLGGDDLSLVCPAKDAINLSAAFIEAFEKESKQINGLSSNLTACGGIAYIKPNYPFYYGLEMAEILCKKAKEASRLKKEAQDPTPSSILFYKIQDSFTEDFSVLLEKEFHIRNSERTFMAGPYSVTDNSFMKIDELASLSEEVSTLIGVKNDLRKWLGMEHLANQKLAQDELLRRINRKLVQRGIPESFIERMHLNTPFSLEYNFKTTADGKMKSACEYQDFGM